jgi:outer membrane protein TolC
MRIGWRSVLMLCALARPAPALAQEGLTLVFDGSETSTAAEEGLGLDGLVELALERNLQVRVSRAQIDEARALYQQAAAQAYPRLEAQMVFGGPTAEAKTAVQNDISTVTEASFGGDLDFGELGVTVRGNVQILQPLFTFGKIDNAKDAADHLVRAAGHREEATKAEVVLNIHRAYWAHQLVHAFVRSLDEGQETLGAVLQRVEALLDADSMQVTENDRLRLTYALATLRVRRAEAETGLERANLALRILTGSPLDAALEVSERELWEALPDEAPPVETTVDEARASRAELLALREVVDAQEAFTEFRRSNLYPDIFFGGLMDFAYTSNATDQTNPFIFDPYNVLDFAAGLGLRWQFDVFSKLAQIEMAEAHLSVRETQEALATQAVELEAREIHAQIEGGYAQLEGLERANRAARGWLTSTVLAYDIGTGDARELIDAFLAWAASEAELSTVRYNTIVHLSELARARGRLVALRTAE